MSETTSDSRFTRDRLLVGGGAALLGSVVASGIGAETGSAAAPPTPTKNDFLVYDGLTYSPLTMGVFNVRNYGALADGSDDTAKIQAAIDAAGAAGGGVVFFPRGTYLLGTYYGQSGGGIFWHLSCAADNMHFLGAPGAVLQATNQHAKVFLCGGIGKNGAGFPDWYKGTNNFHKFTGQTGPTLRALAPGVYARGTYTVTLNNAGDANDLAPGDYVYIRTGQTVHNGFHNTEPDSEINQVVGKNGAVISLQWPLAKDYAQEYYISGLYSRSSTTVTANPVAFGLVKATDRVQRNLSFKGLRFKGSNLGDFPVGVECWQVHGFRMEDCEAQGMLLQALGTTRHARILNNRVYWNGADKYGIVAGAVGDTDVIAEGNSISNASGAMQIHCHEGSAQITVRDNRIYSRPSGEYLAISIGGRAYDHVHDGNIIHTTTTVGAVLKVYEGTPNGGTIVNNLINAPSANIEALAVMSPGWYLANNRAPSFNVAAAESHDALQRLSARVKWDSQSAVLGTVPKGAFISRILIWVDQPFNSNGTDYIAVGTDANHEEFATNTDVSAPPPRKEPTVVGGFMNDSKTAKVFYAAGGSSPTNGFATVILEYTSAVSPYSTF